MWRIGELIDQRVDEFAALESLDNGMPVTYARVVDVALAADHFRYMAGWATKLEGSTIPVSVPYAPGARFLAYTVREPVGVVGAIIPWNLPLTMAAWKLGPALAAGNTVVLKLAEQTPLSASLLAEVLADAGVPEGVVNIVHGFGEVAGAALAAHPGVDKITFTGSTDGKSPNVVFADADLETAIAGAADAIFFNQGEVCTAGSRLYSYDAERARYRIEGAERCNPVIDVIELWAAEAHNDPALLSLDPRRNRRRPTVGRLCRESRCAAAPLLSRGLGKRETPPGGRGVARRPEQHCVYNAG